MINLLRQNQRWLMLLVAVLTIIAFAWLYNTTDFQKLEDSKIAEIYGRTIHKVDIEKQLKVYELAAILGEMPFLQDLGGSAPTPEAASSEFIWNLLVLQHEARQLGIQPTDAQVVAGIRAVPALQKNGTFDSELYQRLLQNVLAPRGMTERHLEDLVRDVLRLQRLREIVTSPVTVSDAEVRDAFRGFQPVDAEFVKLETRAAGSVDSVPLVEVEKIFNGQKDAFVTPEYRNIRYVRLALPPAAASLQGKERVDALQVLAEQATQFVSQVLEGGKSFEAAAAAAQLPVTVTPFFDPAGAPSPGPTSVPANLPIPVIQAAFGLTSAQPLSEIIQDGDGFYIVQLGEILPARPLTFEEARPRIEAQLIAQKNADAFQKYSAEIVRQLQAAVKSGKSFGEAAQTAGLSVQSILNLSPFQQSADAQPDENTLVARATLGLEPGEVTGFQPAPGGGFVAQLTRRAPLDSAIFDAQKDAVRTRILETKQNLLFIEWLTTARTAANLKLLYPQR